MAAQGRRGCGGLRVPLPPSVPSASESENASPPFHSTDIQGLDTLGGQRRGLPCDGTGAPLRGRGRLHSNNQRSKPLAAPGPGPALQTGPETKHSPYSSGAKILEGTDTMSGRGRGKAQCRLGRRQALGRHSGLPAHPPAAQTPAAAHAAHLREVSMLGQQGGHQDIPQTQARRGTKLRATPPEADRPENPSSPTCYTHVHPTSPVFHITQIYPEHIWLVPSLSEDRTPTLPSKNSGNNNETRSLRENGPDTERSLLHEPLQ